MEIAGTIETVRGLTREHLFNFVQKWYVANSMVMAIVGGGNFPALSKKAASLLRRHKAGPSPRWSAFKRKERGGIRSRWFKRDQELSSFVVGYPGLPLNSPLMTTQRVLDKVFGGDTSSRLHNRVREKEGLVYAIGTDSEFFTDAGHTATKTQSIAANASLVLTHILDEYRRFVIDPVTEKELRQAKATLVGDLVGLPEDHEGCAMFYIRSLLLGGGFRQLEDAKRGIEAVDLDAARGLAKKLFSKQKYYMASVGPTAPHVKE
jgi:predicted Zn-dependent peptidase